MQNPGLSPKETIIQRIQRENPQFIGIGELHNSRSAAKFMLDHLDNLFPPGKSCYLLTEFLPVMKTPLHLDAYNTRISSNAVWGGPVGIWQREMEKRPLTSDASLESLYEALLQRSVTIRSIEHESVLYPRIQQGVKECNLNMLEERNNALNYPAVELAASILSHDPDARIVIYAGMTHISDEMIINDTLGTHIKIQGICSLLTAAGDFRGISINIHDPYLCDDWDLLKKIEVIPGLFSRMTEKGESVYYINNSDYLLFVPVCSKYEVPKEGKDHLFVPGNLNREDMLDTLKRIAALQALLIIDEPPASVSPRSRPTSASTGSIGHSSDTMWASATPSPATSSPATSSLAAPLPTAASHSGIAPPGS